MAHNSLVDLIFVRTVSIPNLSLLPCFEMVYNKFLTHIYVTYVTDKTYIEATCCLKILPATADFFHQCEPNLRGVKLWHIYSCRQKAWYSFWMATNWSAINSAWSWPDKCFNSSTTGCSVVIWSKELILFKTAYPSPGSSEHSHRHKRLKHAHERFVVHKHIYASCSDLYENCFSDSLLFYELKFQI